MSSKGKNPTYNRIINNKVIVIIYNYVCYDYKIIHSGGEK